MSFNFEPDTEQVRIFNATGGGDTITLRGELERNSHQCPKKVFNWLVDKCKWTSPTNDPNTGEPLFMAPDYYAIELMYFRWYEAIAYESYLFMTIGGHD